ERDEQRERPERATIEADVHERPGRERNPAATPEREIERREQRNEECSGGCANRGSAPMNREAEREHSAERRERRETVPVAERLREPLGGCGVVNAKHVREQPGAQAEEGDCSDRAQQATEQRPLGSSGAGEH